MTAMVWTGLFLMIAAAGLLAPVPRPTLRRVMLCLTAFCGGFWIAATPFLLAAGGGAS